MAADGRRTLLIRVLDQLAGAECRGDTRFRDRHVTIEREDAGDEEQHEHARAHQHHTARRGNH